jgi:hypothetical protein
VTLSDGTDSATSTFTVTVSATACTSACLRSTDISLRTSGTSVSGRVTVQDENGVAVSGASISATWTKPDGSTVDQTRSTGSQGQANFGTNGNAGTYTLTITDITKIGYTFDPANSVLTKTITK